MSIDITDFELLKKRYEQCVKRFYRKEQEAKNLKQKLTEKMQEIERLHERLIRQPEGDLDP